MIRDKVQCNSKTVWQWKAKQMQASSRAGRFQQVYCDFYLYGLEHPMIGL